MARYSVAEIAEVTKIKAPNIYTYRNRGKINLVDGEFDDTDPLNKIFLEKRNVTLQSKEETKEPVPKQKVKDKPPIQSAIYNDAIHLNKLKAEKLEEEIAELKRRNLKDAGDLIRMDEVMNVFTIHFRNIITTFYNTADNYTSDLCNRLGADRTILAEFRGNLKKVINETVEQAKDQSKKDLKNISGNKNE